MGRGSGGGGSRGRDTSECGAGEGGVVGGVWGGVGGEGGGGRGGWGGGGRGGGWGGGEGGEEGGGGGGGEGDPLEKDLAERSPCLMPEKSRNREPCSNSNPPSQGHTVSSCSW